MNNIYVETMPKSCQQCPYYSYEETEDEFWEFCSWCGYEFSEETCPLKPLSVALAEERKKVVQEIREKALKKEIYYTGGKSKSEWKNEYCIFDFELEEIEKGVNDENLHI